jgi:acyl-CoA synthetase (AMP-forming)/AMP-acid ligase II
MSTSTQISHIRRGSDGPFDASTISRSDADVPYYTGLPPSLVAGLAAVVTATPQAEAIVEVPGRRLSYRELWDAASAVAGGLRAAGVTPGDPVAIDLPNGVDWVVAMLGVLLAGGVIVPVNTRLAPDEREAVLPGSGAVVTIDANTPAPRGDLYVCDTRGPSDTAAIFYTSGTTGRSKGATSTHAALLAIAENIWRSAGIPRNLGAELRTLVCVPLFHVTGFAAQMMTVLLSGGALGILNGLDAGKILATIEQEQISMMVAVPAIYFYLLSSPQFSPDAVAGVRWALYGGAPIAPDLVMKIKAAFPAARIANGFGMSETSSLATLLPHEESEAHADSIGYPCPCVDVAVLDADPASGVGEILLRGQTVTAGYWREPGLAAHSFLDGWLRTGDIGRLDDAGRLYLVDRVKDMINRGGENVFSVEVENALADAPGVKEVAVIGVPDSMMGEKVGCVIVAADALEGVDVDALIRHAAARIADYKLPQFVAIHDGALPRNPAGKVLKHVLREQVVWGSPVR